VRIDLETSFYIFPSIYMTLANRSTPMRAHHREKLGSKAPTKVTFAVGWEGLTSIGILLYNLLNLWMNSTTISEFFFLKAPNSVK